MKIKFFNFSCTVEQKFLGQIKLPPKARWEYVRIVIDGVYTSVFSGKPEIHRFRSNFQHDE